MSTNYNRRRGASANAPRTPRGCTVPVEEENIPGLVDTQCGRIAPRNRYCDDHQASRKKVLPLPEPEIILVTEMGTGD